MNHLLAFLCTLDAQRLLGCALLGCALLGCALLGCSTEYRADAGPLPDGSAPMGALEIESESSVALAFGQEAELVVRYTESGEPVARAPIRFALEGRAHDSTVSELSVSSDSEGRARTSVVAGSIPAAFRVRVSAERAAPVYVNVSVGNEGFGALVVHTEYAGARNAARRRVVEIYASLSCADERPPFADRMTTLDDPSMLEARFRALPAGLSYAVFGRVEGPGGVVLARGCADGAIVTRDGETAIELVFEDTPLAPQGEYDGVLALTSTDSSVWATELASAAGNAHILAAGGDAALYLDALEEELRARGEMLGADTLAAERATGVPDASLTTELEADGRAPTGALAAAMGALRARLTAIALSGPLSLQLVGGSLAGTWDAAQLAVGPSDPDSPALAIDLGAAGLTLAPSLSLSAPMGDTLALDSLTLALPLELLARLTIDAEASARGVSSAGELLAGSAGCDTLAAWIEASPTMAPLCTADCPLAACMRALDGVMSAVDVALETADSARETVELSGTITMQDDNGDLIVDELTSTLTGTWSGPAGGEPLAGGFTAARSPD